MRISGFSAALVTLTAVAAPLSAHATDGESAMLRAQAFSSVLDWPGYSPAMRVFLSALRSASDVTGPKGPARIVGTVPTDLASTGWEVRREHRTVPANGGGESPSVPPRVGNHNPGDYVITTTPEPATMALLAAGLVVMGAVTTIRHRRKV